MELEFKAGNNSEYKVEVIWDSAVYANKAKSYLSGLYYLVEWKRYSEKKNTWKPSFTVKHLKKLINFFHKKHPEKLIATIASIDSALLIPRPNSQAN